MLNLIRNVRIKFFDKGEIIIPRGSTLNEIYFIRKGLVRSYSDAQTPDQEEITFQLFPENNIFANTHTIILKETCRFSFQALEPTKVYVIDYEHFVDATSKDLNLLNMNRTFMGKRLMKQAFQRIESFVFLTPEERYKKYIKDYPNVVNRAPDKYIANVLGITPTSLSRIRKRIATKKH
ncbi:MAG TPA: Crp/Fnr family transcriptional regulator [Cyclobacteriaceae bacterium]